MRNYRFVILIAVTAAAMAGCATPPTETVTQMPATWPDERYAYDPSLISVDANNLLALDGALKERLKSDSIQQLPLEKRIQYLQNQLLGANPSPFTYRFGHSTIASQTWKDRQGDCLSLTVLALAMARDLRLNAVVQEVPVPASFGRRNGVDFRNGHVNLFIDRGPVTDSASPMGFKAGVVIDFEPQEGAFRRGQPLTVQALVARYYNNLGAQALAEQDWRRSYAYLREAVHADPSFGPSLINLSWLYRQTDEPTRAEEVLQLALQRESGHETAVYAMHELLMSQGRVAQALPLRVLLNADQDNDPYYWTGLGLESLRVGDTRRAIKALERAQELTVGFAEVHRYLALAYWHAGHDAKAREQLATLALIDQSDPALSTLQGKLLPRKLHF